MKSFQSFRLDTVNHLLLRGDKRLSHPKLAAAYLALGMVQINHDFDWEGADASLKRAVAVLAPGSVEVVRYQAYVAFLRVNLGILIQKVEAGPSQSKM